MKERYINRVKLDVDEVSYHGKKLEIIKCGEEVWNYKVLLDGKEIDGVYSVSVDLLTGEHPRLWMEIIDG